MSKEKSKKQKLIDQYVVDVENLYAEIITKEKPNSPVTLGPNMKALVTALAEKHAELALQLESKVSQDKGWFAGNYHGQGGGELPSCNGGHGGPALHIECAPGTFSVMGPQGEGGGAGD